jgi:hypothetical protein
MGESAFVTWVVRGDPWVLEEELIQTVSLPLNLQGNNAHPFYTCLKAIRKECKVGAFVQEA